MRPVRIGLEKAAGAPFSKAMVLTMRCGAFVLLKAETAKFDFMLSGALDKYSI